MILLLLLSVVLITLDHRGDAFHGRAVAAHSVVDPAQNGVTTLVAPVGRFSGRLGDLGDSGTKIDALEKENADLRRQLREGELTGHPRRRAAEAGAALRPGPVHGDAGDGDRARPVDRLRVGGDRRRRPSRRGAPDQTVVDSDGLVGRVKDVGDRSSTVVLAVDPGFAVGVRVAGGNALGVAAGNGLGPLTYTPLDPATRVKVGTAWSPARTAGPRTSAGLPSAR